MLSASSQHFQGLRDRPQLKFGGGLLATHPGEGETLQLYGSAATIEADTREEVIAILQDDIYAKSGVWNVSLGRQSTQ